MGVTFYIGRTGTGKTNRLRDNIIDKLKENPKSEKPIIYLVPEQMTFQAEQDLVSRTEFGMSRVHVLSFSRMAWRILKEKGGITRTQLQKSAVLMLLKKVLEDEKEDLRIYHHSADKQGFIEQIERLFTEFKRQNISVDVLIEKMIALENSTEMTADNQILYDKLHDIIKIFSRAESTLDGRYAGTEDYLRLLTEKMTDSKLLKNADVYVDGFHSFTPQELSVLQELMTEANHLTFALTLDKPYEEDIHPLNLFYQTGSTFQKLKLLCEEKGCVIEDTVLFDGLNKDYKRPELRYLENNFEKRPVQPTSANDIIRIHSSVNRRTEIESTAREIRALVQDKGYRFKDIVVAARNMNDYVEIMQTSFRDYNIPLFTDQQLPMIHHPVMEFIRSLLETISERWRYEPLFRTLKTDLLFSIDENWEEAREQVDILENYVLAYGIKEKHWKQKERWIYSKQRTSAGSEFQRREEDDELERVINSLRRKYSSSILRFEKRMKKQQTIEEHCKVLFEFLEEQRIPQKIEKLRDLAANNNELTKTREHEQVWGAIVELLEQLVEVAGDKNISFTTFQKMIEAGLETLTFRLVPPSIDQVTFADLERSRLADVKILFILGVNEGILPMSFEEDGMLSDEERAWFDEHGVELGDDSRRRLLNEQFLIYRALSVANEKLIINYPIADEEGKSLQPSVLISQLKEMFPDVEDQMFFNEPNEYSDEQQAKFIGPFRKTISFLTYQLQLWKKNYPISPVWWDVYNWHVENQNISSFPIAMGSLYYKNRSTSLRTETSRRLYGEKLKASVSRIEQFESCAFSQFASYGLRLKERDVYKLEAPDIGQLFHAALQDMSSIIMKKGKDWGTLTNEECKSLARECVTRLAPQIQRKILLSSSKYNYLQKKLEDTVVRASEILSKQAKVSGFSPAGLELGFGTEAELPPLLFTLPDGTKMEVAGRIDRVDKASGTDGVYVRIIDYKSSVKDVRLAEVYYGLALQMLVYLDVVLSFSEEWLGTKVKPAGVLYFHVHNPFVQTKQNETELDMEKELLKRFKMKGLLSADEEVVRLMDQMLTTGYSQIVPAAIKKDGTFYSSSSVLALEHFEKLRSFIRKKLQDSGFSIMQGRTEIKPYKYKQQVPCTYCSFRSVCQFDVSFEENQYRGLSLDEKKIKTELFSGDEGDNA